MKVGGGRREESGPWSQGSGFRAQGSGLRGADAIKKQLKVASAEVCAGYHRSEQDCDKEQGSGADGSREPGV